MRKSKKKTKKRTKWRQSFTSETTKNDGLSNNLEGQKHTETSNEMLIDQEIVEPRVINNEKNAPEIWPNNAS